MAQELIDLKADFAFKQVFAREGNEAILVAFLNAVLDLPVDQEIKYITIQNAELARFSREHRASFLDLLVKTDQNVYINVEIQLLNRKNIVPRILWYWVHLVYNRTKSGSLYKDFPPTISLAILDYDEFEETHDFHNPFHLVADKTKFQLTDLLEVHFVELPKVLEKWRAGEVSLQEDTQARWLLLFEAHQNQELWNELEGIIMQEKEMSKLVEQWKEMSYDPEHWYEYGLWRKAQMDEASMLDEAFEKGIEKGIEQSKVEFAKILLTEGASLTLIMKSTGLSSREIERLKEKL